MSYTYDDIKVGDQASFTKTIAECDVYNFAGIIGDFNSAHINQVEAEKSPFGGRIVHGCLVDSLVSTVLGMIYPGPGTIFMGKTVQYTAPVRIGDTITATITVSEKGEKGTVYFTTSYTNQDGKEVIKGTATVKAPRKK